MFMKGRFEVTYVTFCGEIAVERLLRVGYLGCLGKGKFFVYEDVLRGFPFIRTEERE